MNPPQPQPNTAVAPASRRAMCGRCKRPVSVCYCAALTTLETDTRIVILQHPREQGMPIGTAHMATLCLPQASLHVGTSWDESDVLREACGDPARPPILLYPGPDARDILEEPPEGPVTLIVVDGTWSQARTLVRDNPALARLPRYAFQAPEPSTYRIRKEPCDTYVSTLEALMHVLGVLEEDPAKFRALLQPMNTMVEIQIEAQRKARAAREAPRMVRRRARPRLSPHERLPLEVRERYEDLVLVFGDANAWPYGTPERGLGDELIHWVAYRPSSGESLSFVLAPRNPLAPGIPSHVGLSAEELLGGAPVSDLLSAVAAFTQPTDVTCSWGHHGLRLLQDCGGAQPSAFLDLQQAARALTGTKVGSIERFAAAHDIPPATAGGPGRAGRRLGLLDGVLAMWRGLARP